MKELNDFKNNPTFTELCSKFQRTDVKRLSIANKLKKLQEIENVQRPKIRVMKSNYQYSDLLRNYSANWNVEKLENSLARISDSTEEQIKIIEIQARNKTKKEMLNAVINTQQQYAHQFFEMSKIREKMREDLSYKSRLINKLIRYFTEQIFLESDFGLFEPEIEPENPDQSERVKMLEELIEINQNECDTVRFLYSEYQEEAQCAINKVRQADEQIKKIIEAHIEKKNKLEKIYEKKERVYLSETMEIRHEFQEFKKKISQEINLRSLLEIRQKQFINELFEELKNAKTILQNPTLRLKTYEKFKEHKKKLIAKTPIPTIEFKSFNSPGFSPGNTPIITVQQKKKNNRSKSSYKPLNISGD